MNSMEGTAPRAKSAARDRTVHAVTKEADVGLGLLRALGEGPEPERLDDATAILGECLVIPDGLDQTCVEVLADDVRLPV